ncbi:hypothetical protein ACWEPC_59795 [Nonomuraea sp. NPDC004297]
MPPRPLVHRGQRPAGDVAGVVDQDVRHGHGGGEPAEAVALPQVHRVPAGLDAVLGP